MRAITSVSHCHKQHQLSRPRRPSRPLQLRSFCNNALLTILLGKSFTGLWKSKSLQYSVHFSPRFSRQNQQMECICPEWVCLRQTTREWSWEWRRSSREKSLRQLRLESNFPTNWSGLRRSKKTHYFEGGNESSGTLVALDELCHCHECIFCFCGISLSSGASFLSIAQSCPNTDYDGSGGNIWLLSLKGLLQGSTKESFRMRHYSSKKCSTKNWENGKHFG